MLRKIFTVQNIITIGILIVFALMMSIVSVAFNTGGFTSTWASGFLQNFATELLGAALTFVFIDLIVKLRVEKQRLIRELRSNWPEVARRAAEEIYEEDYHTDGTLRNQQLTRAYLSEADFEDADLMGARLQRADMRRINLRYANLRNTQLIRADLKNADLQFANFANANLRGVRLEGALMQGAKLQGAEFSENTMLPDGTYWSEGTDISRFTDPNHHDYYNPEKDDNAD